MEVWPSATPTSAVRSLGARLNFLRRETYYYLQYVLAERWPG